MNNRIILILTAFFLTSYCNTINAQKPVYDEAKHYQLRSMETGPWDFRPAWWYYWMHKKYSGASSHWKWQGLKSGWVVRFSDNRYYPSSKERSKILGETLLAKKKYIEIREKYDAIEERELLDYVDRNVDIIIQSHKKKLATLEALFFKTLREYTLLFGEDQFTRHSLLELNKIKSNINTLNRAYIKNSDRNKGYMDEIKRFEQLILKCNRVLMHSYALSQL